MSAIPVHEGELDYAGELEYWLEQGDYDLGFDDEGADL